MEPDVLVRITNIVLTFLVSGTLAWRTLYYWDREAGHERFRRITKTLVFAGFGVASGVALSRGLPLPYTVKVLSVLTALYLFALWTPWRWQARRLMRDLRRLVLDDLR